MPSQHSSFAPARSSAPPRRSLHALTVQPGFRIKLKPRRDALTRVRHDLRSLLQSVVGYADLLAEPRYGVLSSEQERFVGHVRAAAGHLQELVDTCIELSRPENDNGRVLEAPQVQVGQSLQRVRNTLLARELCCDLTIAPELETRSVGLDVSILERALVGLAGVVTRDGAVALQLRASRLGSRILLTLSASDAGESELVNLEALEDQLGNRDFVRLKLSEVLLSRLGFATRIGANVDQAELVF
ncbi:MAG: histidine kinase dimerization/phospho-acceptor domain-containing protein [Polyangiales bacterium]